MARCLPPLFLFVFILPLCAENELQESPFAVLFPAAFTHYSPFADVAAKGGASAASPFGSSFNLAGIAWSFEPDEFDYLASANYGFLTFDSGTELHLNTQTIAFDAADMGVFRFALVEFESNRGLLRNGATGYDFDLLGSRLDWSKRLGDYGIGAGLGYTNAETLFSRDLLRLSDSEKDNVTGRLSIQRQVWERWLIGAAADIGGGETEVLRETAPGVGVRSFESSHQWIAQTGVAYQITPKAAAHLDYQIAHLAHEAAELDIHRWAFGTDLPVGDRLMLRTGVATDQWGHVGFSGGVAFFPRRGTTLNLAFQDGMTPELDREFGKSRLFNFSVSVKW